jgi:hypothetical protein
LAIQPDIYLNQRSTAYGYTIPGGLIQYHLIGPEILAADDGAYVIPLDESIGYAEAALTEPWACVDAAYTQRRRLVPKDQGAMWIVGDASDSTEYRFSRGLEAPRLIYLTDIPNSLKEIIRLKCSKNTKIVETEKISLKKSVSSPEKRPMEKGLTILFCCHQSQESSWVKLQRQLPSEDC